MTFLPFEERHKVKGADGDEYTIPRVCSNPGCFNSDVQRHHLVRRSELAGAYDWIEYEGVLIQNVVGLCLEHHEQITVNKAAIVWSNLGYFNWVSTTGTTAGTHRPLGHVDGKLDPHPQVGVTTPVYHPPVDPEICPECKRPHRRKGPQEKARARTSWSIHVPADERENGADVLDTLLDEARKMMAVAGLPYGDEDNARYYVLAATLGLFVQHGVG